MARQSVSVDPAVLAALSNRHQPVSKRVRARRRRSEAAGRTAMTLELNSDAVHLLRAVARREGISPASLVNVMTEVFLRAYAAGDVDVHRYVRMSRSPRYEWASDIDLSELMFLTKGEQNE